MCLPLMMSLSLERYAYLVGKEMRDTSMRTRNWIVMCYVQKADPFNYF